MPKLKSSGYVPSEESRKPGYLQRRMAAYRLKLAQEKEARERREGETKRKVSRIGKAA